ncbi:MAG TPA: nickel pincer cofactor biosynthesis protein LarC [Bryobacteraceae bacterium]|nr:nickel pincer cofactor biosynthesis protein LarC [Bryobacteraceae bacterium]
MKVCYIDAFSGISGDMTVGALLDAGAPSDDLIEALRSLDTGARYEVEKTHRGGMVASKFRVISPVHPAGAHGHSHRHLKSILGMIEKAPISDRAKADASRVFERLGDAEAHVHGVPVEQVHFHEVGAADSIADIVGACVAFDLLGIQEIRTSAINVGSGTVKTEHGVLPVPAPATAELLAGKPIYARGPAVELTTPTGAALAATLSAGFGPVPAMNIGRIGYGAGDHDFKEQPNVLRVLIGEKAGAVEATLVSVLEANIDDSSPQVLGYAMERLLEAGALDASISPLQMKKNRPGALLRVIARPEDQETLSQIVFAETSTLGLRIYAAERRVQERRVVEVDTSFGKVRGKVSGHGSFAPEYDDCKAIATSTGAPLREILAAAAEAYARTRS